MLKKVLYAGCATSVLFLLLLIWVGSGIEVAAGSNYTLTSNKPVHGTLFILAQNATLAEDSSVDGSVVMLCCNLTIKGKVRGDVFLLTGNLLVPSVADIGGEVGTLAGNVSR
jgi:hypothetical protein